MPIYDEAWNMPGRSAIPGGSAMNSARAANYFMNHRNRYDTVSYFGSIGEDDKGKVLEDSISSARINGCFHKTNDNPTGTCAVLV